MIQLNKDLKIRLLKAVKSGSFEIKDFPEFIDDLRYHPIITGFEYIKPDKNDGKIRKAYESKIAESN